MITDSNNIDNNINYNINNKNLKLPEIFILKMKKWKYNKRVGTLCQGSSI